MQMSCWIVVCLKKPAAHACTCASQSCLKIRSVMFWSCMIHVVIKPLTCMCGLAKCRLSAPVSLYFAELLSTAAEVLLLQHPMGGGRSGRDLSRRVEGENAQSTDALHHPALAGDPRSERLQKRMRTLNTVRIPLLRGRNLRLHYCHHSCRRAPFNSLQKCPLASCLPRPVCPSGCTNVTLSVQGTTVC